MSLSVTSVFLTSDPDTWNPRFSSTSAMPLIPMPPIPTKWILSTLWNTCLQLLYQLLFRIFHINGPDILCHTRTLFRILPQLGDCKVEFFPGDLAVPYQVSAPYALHIRGIFPLMSARRKGIGDEDGRLLKVGELEDSG